VRGHQQNYNKIFSGNITTLENINYKKKELIILIISMMILISTIISCYIILTIKRGNTIWVTTNTYISIADIEFLISQIYFLFLALILAISNFKIFSKKRITILSLSLLIPSWIILLFSNIKGVIVHTHQQINIPKEYLLLTIWYLIVLILNLIPAYYIRLKYYSYLEYNNELNIENL